MSRSQSDVLQLQETFELLVTTLADILSLAGIIIAMLLTNWQLALISLSIIPPLFFVLAYWQRFARHSFMRIRRAIAMVNGEYNQNITGVRVVQSLNRQPENLKHFNGLNQELLDANLEASRFSGSLQPIVECLTGIGMGFGVILMGGLLLQRGEVAWGVLIAFALWVQRFFEPIRQLTMQYSQLQRAMAAGVRIFELLDVQPEVQDAPDAPEMPPLKGEIIFANVSFHYVPGVEVLQDINLHIRPGETVALVGATGAGKSTLATLLHRFADVTQGKIMIDGFDIREVRRQSLVRQMSMVLQEPYLFSGTVQENIRYACTTASDADVIAAAQAVGAHDFIMALAQGYDTPLAERGVNLSVGQRQLHQLRPCHRRQSPHPHPGRGHGEYRHAHGNAHPACPAAHSARAHLHCDCAPPLDHPQCRQDCGVGARPHRRSGHTCRTPRTAWCLRSPVCGKLWAASERRSLARRERRAGPDSRSLPLSLRGEGRGEGLCVRRETASARV